MLHITHNNILYYSPCGVFLPHNSHVVFEMSIMLFILNIIIILSYIIVQTVSIYCNVMRSHEYAISGYILLWYNYVYIMFTQTKRLYFYGTFLRSITNKVLRPNNFFECYRFECLIRSSTT